MKETAKEYDMIVTMYQRVSYLSKLARNQGLLALEETLSKICREETGKPVSFAGAYPWKNLTGPMRLMVELGYFLIEGYPEKNLEEIAKLRYEAAEYDEISELAVKMTIVGMLSICKGENTKLTKIKMLSVLPEEPENQLIEAELAQKAREEAETENAADSLSFLTEDELGALIQASENK